jgi:uncharacterized protein YggE
MKTLFSTFMIILLTQIPAHSAEIKTITNRISVSGSGRIDVQPEMATISMSVMTRSQYAKEAQAMNALQSEQLKRALVQKFSLGENDLISSSYTVMPEYQVDSHVIIGYIVTHSFDMKLKDISRVGDAVDTAGQSGATSIDSIQFGLTNQKDYELKTLKLAMDDALIKAQTIAAAAGREISKVLSVAQNGFNVQAKRYSSPEKDEAPGTDINPDLITITANLTVVYEF